MWFEREGETLLLAIAEGVTEVKYLPDVIRSISRLSFYLIFSNRAMSSSTMQSFGV